MILDHLPFFLAVVGIDDMFYAAVISALINGAAQAASPKTSMKTPMDVPKPDPGQVDFNQLVQQQQQSELPKLKLQDRLPPPNTY